MTFPANIDHHRWFGTCSLFFPFEITLGLKHLMTSASIHGYSHSHHGPPSTLKTFLDGGLLILSKYPILKFHTLEFQTKASHSDGLASKGALHCLIDVDGKEVDVFTSHTQASYSYTASPEIDAIQRSQITELSNFINDKMTSNSAIFGGDLNVDAFQNNVNGTYTFLIEEIGSGFEECVDVILKEDGTFPETSVGYCWDKVSCKELVLGSYIGRKDVKKIEEEEEEGGYDIKAARYDYLLLLNKRKGGVVVKKVHGKVQKFEQGEECEFRYLSDHFAVEAEVEIAVIKFD
ncbi:hypothetical protein TrLO_g11376 [Triparma laevis f. longispina]|uniref:Sphingomyelin phosphodiesterase n=1 Tax=Triparma laevis f. longispina TaxID=1714387 RepID=A0A9W7C1X1_9STRA|nr:hypothetical protein TrLO_g11376 [Triparma laevis f. longispina]